MNDRDMAALEGPDPDALTYIVAAHIINATPWECARTRSPAYDAVMGARRLLNDRVRRLQARAQAVNRHRPWWPAK